MTAPGHNPFAAAVAPPVEQAPQQAPAPAQAPQQHNPYAQQQAAQPTPQQAPQGNPFGNGVPQQAAPAAYAPPAPQQAPPPPQAPQAYAPPNYSSPYGVAPGAQHAPAIYGGPQQAPPAAPTAPPVALDPSMLRGAPAPVVGEGRGAKLAHMYGRLVLVFPLSITMRPRTEKYITPEQRQRGDLTQEQVTATFVVLDDGVGGMQPIRFGGNPTAFPPVPDTESAPLPYVRKGLWVTQSRVISQLRDFLPMGPGEAPRPICGRVVKEGPAQNDPWYITTATEAELGLAQQYMQLVAAGTYPHPLA